MGEWDSRALFSPSLRWQILLSLRNQRHPVGVATSYSIWCSALSHPFNLAHCSILICNCHSCDYIPNVPPTPKTLESEPLAVLILFLLRKVMLSQWVKLVLPWGKTFFFWENDNSNFISKPQNGLQLWNLKCKGVDNSAIIKLTELDSTMWDIISNSVQRAVSWKT